MPAPGRRWRGRSSATSIAVLPRRGVLALVGMALTLAPAVGPAIGGYLQTWFGWRAIFLALGLFGVAVLTAAFFMAETNRRRDPAALDPRRMVANYRRLAMSPAYLGYVAIVACTLGGLLSYVAASPFVLISIVGAVAGGVSAGPASRPPAAISSGRSPPAGWSAAWGIRSLVTAGMLVVLGRRRTAVAQRRDGLDRGRDGGRFR